MLIVIDKRIPTAAKKKLAQFGEIVEFETEQISYESISGHPDIFLCQTPNHLICAANTPQKYLKLFEQHKISFQLGKNSIGQIFPETSHYNCVVTENLVIHHRKYTDPTILAHASEQKFIQVNQAYTRCNLMALGENAFITSDKGIEQTLLRQNLAVDYFSPEEILLPGFKNGFIGGCLGIFSKKLFVLGNPHYRDWNHAFQKMAHTHDLEIISLYNGPLFDGGSIFFLE